MHLHRQACNAGAAGYEPAVPRAQHEGREHVPGALVDECGLEAVSRSARELYERGEYEIVSVLLSKVYKTSDKVFKYYQFYNAESEAEFDAYIANVKAMALYDTGVEAQYGDELITLSTCEYSTENGRIAIVARKIAE